MTQTLSFRQAVPPDIEIAPRALASILGQTVDVRMHGDVVGRGTIIDAHLIDDGRAIWITLDQETTETAVDRILGRA